MNWLIVALPLITSLSLAVPVVLLTFSIQQAFKDIKVPSQQVREPDLRAVVSDFSKVFSHEVPEGETVVEEDYIETTTDIKVLALSVGIKNLALVKAGEKTFVIEEGEQKGDILLKRLTPKEAVFEVKGREVKVIIKREKPVATTTEPTKGEILSDIRISRREIERITKDPGIMFREIRLVPYVKNGRTEGFIFEWIRPGSLFYKAGLRKGDILLSINNMTIKSGEDAFRLLQVLRNEPSLKVVVLRNGQRKEINVRIE